MCLLYVTHSLLWGCHKKNLKVIVPKDFFLWQKVNYVTLNLHMKSFVMVTYLGYNYVKNRVMCSLYIV